MAAWSPREWWRAVDGVDDRHRGVGDAARARELGQAGAAARAELG
jgi:hypothetical protein